MKLKVIGRNGPYPSAGSACSGYLLESASAKILIDCGTGILARLAAHCGFDDLDAVILSHLHYDHMSDLLPMIYAIQFHPRKAPLPVYLPESPEQVRSLLDVPCYELREMTNCEIGDLALSFLPVRHPVQTFALRAECGGRVFVYTGDTNETDSLPDFCADADLLLADAGLSEADWHDRAPHLSALRCGHLAKEACARKLLLTHLNPKYQPDALTNEAKTVFPNVEFAEGGAVYEI